LMEISRVYPFQEREKKRTNKIDYFI